MGHSNGSLNTSYGLTVKLHFIDGTSGVYLVNTGDSKNINTFYKLKMSAAVVLPAPRRPRIPPKS